MDFFLFFWTLQSLLICDSQLFISKSRNNTSRKLYLCYKINLLAKVENSTFLLLIKLNALNFSFFLYNNNGKDMFV